MAQKHNRQPLVRNIALLREVSVKSPASAHEVTDTSKEGTSELVQREYPQTKAEALAQDETSIQRDKLIDHARNLLSRGLKAGLAAGRAYNELKSFFPHGKWLPFLKAEAARFGLSFRTLQEYMRMAREHDALVKKEKSASFGKADDPQAQAISSANKRAKATRGQIDEQLPSIVTAPSNRKINRNRKAGIYRLPLSLTGQQKLYLDALQDLPNWGDIELAIITNLKKLFVLYGVANDLAESGIHDDREVNPIELDTNINFGTANDAAQA